MKKKIAAIGSLLTLILSGCALAHGASSTAYSSSVDDYASAPSKSTGSDDFTYAGNLVTGDLDIDGVLNEPEWSTDGILTIKYGENDRVTCKIYWGDKGITVGWVSLDQFISASTDYGNDQFVINSDDVEFYIDAKDNGGSGPQTDDYEFIIDAEGYAMLQVGGGKWWGPWSGVVDYATSIKGTLNNDSDIDTEWCAELFLPYDTLGFAKDSQVGVALGCRNKTTNLTTSDWYGWTPDPQVPSTYVPITKDGVKVAMVEGYTERAGSFAYDSGLYQSSVKNSLMTKNDASFTQGTLATNITIPSQSDDGIVFGLSASEDLYWESGASYYFFFLNIDGNALLGRVKNGVWSTLFTSAKVTEYAYNTTVTLKVSVVGDLITGYVNDHAYAAATDRNFLSGTGVGLRAGAAGTTFTDLAIANA
jgi:hypothetical protein